MSIIKKSIFQNGLVVLLGIACPEFEKNYEEPDTPYIRKSIT